jgi:hypothetical protein
MSLFHRLRVWLLAVGLVHLALPSHAAELDRKYLLDDSHLVVTVNVQKTLESAAYKKQFQPQVDGLLKTEVVQAVIKDLGFDPLKDIERITVVMGLSSHKDEPRMENGQIVGFDSQAGPLIIVQGRFDAAKLEAKAKQLVADLKVHEVGAYKVYEASGNTQLFGVPMFAALPDSKTLILGRFQDQVTDALDKAAGKKKTQIKSKVMAGLLDKLDTDQAVAAAVSGDMVGGRSTSVSNNNGQVVATVQHKTIKEEAGIDSLLLTIRVGDDVQGDVIVAVADAAKAKEMAQSAEAGVQKQIDQLKALIENLNVQVPAKQLAPGLNVLKAIKVSTKDNTVIFKAQVTAQVAADFVQTYFAWRNPAAAAPPQPVPEPAK